MTLPNQERRMLDELLILATYDWLVPGFFVQAADLAVIDAEPEVRTAIGMGLAAESVARGWFRIGHVDHDGFGAWSGTTEQAIGRLIGDWLREERPDRPTEFAWFELTDPGRAAAMERRQARAVRRIRSPASMQSGMPDTRPSPRASPRRDCRTPSASRWRR